MKSQPSDAMMGFVWVLGFVMIGAMKAYHAAWLVKDQTRQRNRYIILGVMQAIIIACVVWGFTLGNLSDYREAVNGWGDIAWVFKITSGMTLATPFLTALVGWQIHRHPVKSKHFQ
jgi:membrane protease YdiL (CAAX protease family)